MKVESTQVLIAGAGPAGSATALFLARAGLDVTVVEARCGTKNSVCGEGIMPAGLSALAELGLLEPALAAGGRFFHGIDYYPRSGSPARGSFPARRPPIRGLTLSRLALDELLERAMASEPRIRLLKGHNVVELLTSGGRVTGAVVWDREDSQPWKLKADLSIGADGISSRFHKLDSVHVVRPSRRRFGLRLHLSGVEDLSDHVEIHLIRRGEVYVTPQGAGRTSIALLVDQQDLPRHADLNGYILSRVQEAGALVEKTQKSQVIDTAQVKGPLGTRVTGTFGPGYVLIGDAAGALDPVTGEGLSLALCTANALGRAVTRYGLTDTACRYAVETRQSMECNLRRMTSGMLFLLRNPLLAHGAIAAVRAWPRLFSWCLGIAAGPQDGVGFAARGQPAL